MVELPRCKHHFNSHKKTNLFSLIATKLARTNNSGGGSRGFVLVTSADCFRMREIECVGMVALVYIGRLLRMSGDSLLMYVCGSLGGGFTVKGESDV